VLSAVSHELRGPLGVARGYLRLLESHVQGDPRALKTVEQAGRATTRMAELLDELSEYARWVRGEQVLVMAPGSLRQVLLTVARDTPLPQAPAIRLEVDALVDVTAPVDAPRLARALVALATAAARAQTEDAAILLNVRPHDPGHAVVGIVPHHLRDASATDRPPALERAGAGLSLALTDLIVHRHGGRLVERWVGDAWAGYVCFL
jgi:signal transduction histidine kinase